MCIKEKDHIHWIMDVSLEQKGCIYLKLHQPSKFILGPILGVFREQN